MRSFTKSTVLCVWVGTLVGGCGSPQKSESPNLDASFADVATEADAPSGTLKEWKEIWSVEVRGKEVSARKVGYLEKSSTPESPDTRYYVRDLLWDIKGFLLTDGKAFAFEPRNSNSTVAQELGNMGVENGAKKILKVTGEIQLRAPSPPPAPTTNPVAK